MGETWGDFPCVFADMATLPFAVLCEAGGGDGALGFIDPLFSFMACSVAFSARESNRSASVVACFSSEVAMELGPDPALLTLEAETDISFIDTLLKNCKERCNGHQALLSEPESEFKRHLSVRRGVPLHHVLEGKKVAYTFFERGAQRFAPFNL